MAAGENKGRRHGGGSDGDGGNGGAAAAAVVAVVAAAAGVGEMETGAPASQEMEMDEISKAIQPNQDCSSATVKRCSEVPHTCDYQVISLSWS